MNIVGIIAEYNPFHRGHAWHIAETRRLLGGETAVVCAMSGHWVQRGDCAAADKWTRARLALLGGADLILELPTPWALSSAETFARGGVEVLTAAGVVETLSFGSEAGDLAPLSRAAACLDSEAYRAALRRRLGGRGSFAACRQAAAAELLGEEGAAPLARPNNNLGIEYLRALSRQASPPRPMTIGRRGAEHGEEPGPAAIPPEPGFASASAIRGMLLDGNWAGAEACLPPGSGALLRSAVPALPSLTRCRRAILARLRAMTDADWAALPDSGAAEGLPRRLVRAARQAVSPEEFCALAKTRRYTHARLRRLLLCAFLDLRAEETPVHVPYLRVLGHNSRGREVLRAMSRAALLPILTKPAHARRLPGEGGWLFEREARWTDLYGLCLPQVPPGGAEWVTGPVIL